VGDLFYEIEAKTVSFSEPYPLSEEDGVHTVNLDPITPALPKRAPYPLSVKDSLSGYRVSGGTPQPVKLSVNEIVWELSGLEKPEGLTLELVKAESGLTLVSSLPIWAALAPPVVSAGILTYSLIHRRRRREA